MYSQVGIHERGSRDLSINPSCTKDSVLKAVRVLKQAALWLVRNTSGATFANTHISSALLRFVLPLLTDQRWTWILRHIAIHLLQIPLSSLSDGSPTLL